MKLYYFPGACPLVSHIVMEWAGQKVELVEVSREEAKQDAYLKLNPMGAVPTVVEGDNIFTQSSAIVEYIAEKHPHSKLLPDDLVERTQARKWLAFCNADIHRTFGLIFGAPKFVQSPEAQEELINNAKAMLVNMFSIVDRHLENKSWLAGSKSVADPYLYVLLRWTKVKDVDVSHLTNLARFYEQMEADPGVQKALKAQGLA